MEAHGFKASNSISITLDTVRVYYCLCCALSRNVGHMRAVWLSCVFTLCLDAFEAMNHVDFLLQNPFTSLKQEDKLHIKSLGPHQPKDISFSCFDGKVNRHFKTSLYESVKWLTISVEKKTFILFICVFTLWAYSRFIM